MSCPICGDLNSDFEADRYLPNFFKCSACKGFFHRHTEKPVYSKSYFVEGNDSQNKKSVFSPLLDLFLYLRLVKIKQFLPVGGVGKILDYGCGNGKLIAYLREKGLNVEGYDPSDSAVSMAQKKNLPVFRGIPDKKYDLIMFWHCLEHTDVPLNDLRLSKRYLASRGRIIIAVPNAGGLEARIFKRRWFCYDWPYHRIHFTPAALAKMLDKVGFKIISEDYFNPEYTISSLAQTVLNIFLPANALYSIVSNRRMGQNKAKVYLLGLASFLILLVLSPVLIIFFLLEVLIKKTAAIIIVADVK